MSGEPPGPSSAAGSSNGSGIGSGSNGSSPEERARAQIRAALEAMTPEQRRAAASKAAEEMMKRRRVEVNGKAMSLARFKRRVEELQRRYESGAYDETVRTIPRWQARELTPGHTIRQGANKMQLRVREEAELELDRFGHGISVSPRPVVGTLLGPRKDFVWGIYARPPHAERVLSGRWAGRDPERVLSGERFYREIMEYAHQMELTLMVLTSRPLPLAATRQEFAGKLEESLKAVTGKPQLQAEDAAALSNFVSLFDDKRVAPAGWVDSKTGCVKEGTHFIFSTTPKGDLAIEAITPGPIKDRKTSYIGVNRNPRLTGAVFNLFLGAQPLDGVGKREVGHGMLFVANGYRFRPWEAKPDQVEMVMGPDGKLEIPPPPREEMDLPVRPSVFQFVDQTTQPLRRMLLGGVRRAQRRAAAAATQQGGGAEMSPA